MSTGEAALFNSLMDVAQTSCAPFWWSVSEPGQPTRILHNGTICYVDTGQRKIGITADHVYQKYLNNLKEYGAAAIECQFGEAIVAPEDRVIDRDLLRDVATFDVPDVITMNVLANRKIHHHSPRWPPTLPEKGDPVLYGGYPGKFRSEQGVVTELPAMWVAGTVAEVTAYNIVLQPNFRPMRWRGVESVPHPGGCSGGPVFRFVDAPIARLEFAGFIYEGGPESVLARHADVVLADGRIS